jgi:hypothetical protein
VDAEPPKEMPTPEVLDETGETGHRVANRLGALFSVAYLAVTFVIGTVSVAVDGGLAMILGAVAAITVCGVISRLLRGPLLVTETATQQERLSWDMLACAAIVLLTQVLWMVQIGPRGDAGWLGAYRDAMCGAWIGSNLFALMRYGGQVSLSIAMVGSIVAFASCCVNVGGGVAR